MLGEVKALKQLSLEQINFSAAHHACEHAPKTAGLTMVQVVCCVYS